MDIHESRHYSRALSQKQESGRCSGKGVTWGLAFRSRSSKTSTNPRAHMPPSPASVTRSEDQNTCLHDGYAGTINIMQARTPSHLSHFSHLIKYCGPRAVPVRGRDERK
jgi:hypothetical protein